MTRDEARRRAVEAAAEAIFNASGTARLQTWERYRAFYAERGVLSPDYFAQAEAAVTSAERAMADAGWRMVRATPTDAMCFAGAKALDEMQAPSAVLMGIGYLAMLAEDDAGG